MGKCTRIYLCTISAIVPEFVIPLNDVSVVEHTEATFTTKLNDAELEVTWFIKDKEVKPDKKKYSIVHENCTHKLIIKDCVKEDMGPIKVVSRGVEASATLTVTGRSGFEVHVTQF